MAVRKDTDGNDPGWSFMKCSPQPLPPKSKPHFPNHVNSDLGGKQAHPQAIHPLCLYLGAPGWGSLTHGRACRVQRGQPVAYWLERVGPSSSGCESWLPHLAAVWPGKALRLSPEGPLSERTMEVDKARVRHGARAGNESRRRLPEGGAGRRGVPVLGG